MDFPPTVCLEKRAFTTDGTGYFTGWSSTVGRALQGMFFHLSLFQILFWRGREQQIFVYSCFQGCVEPSVFFSLLCPFFSRLKHSMQWQWGLQVHLTIVHFCVIYRTDEISFLHSIILVAGVLRLQEAASPPSQPLLKNALKKYCNSNNNQLRWWCLHYWLIKRTPPKLHWTSVRNYKLQLFCLFPFTLAVIWMSSG